MMTGFREQGSGIPLMLLHGISSGAASWHKQMALKGFRVLAGYARLWRKPDADRRTGECGDYADALAAMLDRAGLAGGTGRPFSRWCQRLCGEVSPGAASGAGRCRAGLRSGRTGAARAGLAGREQQMALGGEILAQTRAAKLLRPGAAREDIATVASGMRKLRPEGYLPPRGCWPRRYSPLA
jgi:hypothetical protein